MGVDARMMVTAPSVLTDRELQRLSYELMAAFGTGPFWLGYPDRDHRALTPCPDWLEIDAPKVQTYQVHLAGRYYGIGYERGPWPTYAAIWRWFRLRLPGCRVFYGGDSGDYLGELTPEDEALVWEHFARYQERPYRDGFDRISDDDIPRPLCTFCDEPMVRNGWGGIDRTFGAFYCYCGAHAETRDGGKSWTGRDKEPISVVLAQVSADA